MNEHELKPTGRQKSFYGKAAVIERNGELLLRSYETIVCKIDKNGEFRRLWGGYSATTMRHIDAFRTQHGMNAIGKRDWDRLEVE